MTNPSSSPFQTSLSSAEFFCLLEPEQNVNQPVVYDWKFQRNAQFSTSDRFNNQQNITHTQLYLSFRFIWFFCSTSFTDSNGLPVTFTGNKLVEYQGMLYQTIATML